MLDCFTQVFLFLYRMHLAKPDVEIFQTVLNRGRTWVKPMKSCL